MNHWFREIQMISRKALSRFHDDERGNLIEEILKIAAIAIPILVVMYFIMCTFKDRIIELLQSIGVDISEQIQNIC